MWLAQCRFSLRKLYEFYSDKIGYGCRAVLQMCLMCGVLSWHGLVLPLATADEKQSVEESVAQALRAETEGRNDQRNKRLRELVTASPDHSPVRWHLGQIKVGDLWMSPDEVAESTLNDSPLQQYIAMRQLASRPAQWIRVATPGNGQPGVYRKSFNLPSKPIRADISVVALGEFELFVNGKRIGTGGSARNITVFNAASAVRDGKNSIAVKVNATGPQRLMVWMEGNLKDNSIFTVASDLTWKALLGGVDKWHVFEFDDANWTFAELDDSEGAANTPDDSSDLNAIPSTSSKVDESLADWCATHSLEPQARLHWSRVLVAFPNHPVALNALGLKNVGDDLLTDQQIVERKAAETILKKAMGRWSTPLATARKMMTNVKSEKAVESGRRQIEDTIDPEAIPVLRSLLSHNTRSQNAPFAKACIVALGRMNNPAADQAIVEAVYYHPDPDVSGEAAAVLANRDLKSFIPSVMMGLEEPAQLITKVDVPSRSVGTFEEVKKYVGTNDEGHPRVKTLEVKVKRFVWTFPARTVVTRLRPEGEVCIRDLKKLTYTTDENVEQSHFEKNLDVDLKRMQNELLAANQNREWHNKGLCDLLIRLTDQDLGSNPARWWEWWREYNELHPSSYPSPAISWWGQFRQSQLMNHPQECFGCDTPVWTRRGRVRIGDILSGDEVLAQDPNTGEVAYKMVLNAVIRPACPALQFDVGRDSLVTMPGHRFWQSGPGWRQARHVDKGKLLHGLTGSLPLRGYSEIGPEPMCGLIVEDFHTYFVGVEKILAHDAGVSAVVNRELPGLPRATGQKE